MEQKRKLLTHEDYEHSKNLTEVDRNIMRAAETGEGTVEIKSVEEFMELAEKAKAVHDKYLVHARQIMNSLRAQEVYKYRITDRCTWRAVAVRCWSVWPEANWNPATNQLAGMALCQVAAEILKLKFPDHDRRE